MKKNVFLFLSMVWLALAAGTARGEEFDHSNWGRVLEKFVTETGRVDYAALKADSADLDRYVTQLAARSPASHPRDFPTRNSQLAYWINAYNALVMKGVIEKWPVKSVVKIGLLPHSFFWRKKFVVGGKKYTLNNIEKDILLKGLAEPRIHFALVCASNSCPPPRREAFTAENTERLLEEGARAFVNDSRHVRIEVGRNRITLSKIFDWYKGDFEKYARAQGSAGGENALLDFLLIYADEPTRQALDTLDDPKIDHFDYDWGINDVNAWGTTTDLAGTEGQPR